MKEGEKKLKIGLFLGGSSSEKEISLESGRHIYNNLNPNKYQIVPIFVDYQNHLWQIAEGLLWMNTCADIEAELTTEGQRIYYEDLRSLIDYAFLALHGKYGEECFPALLQLFNIPNNSSGVLGGALGMDKAFQKQVLLVNHSTIPQFLVLNSHDYHQNSAEILTKIENKFSYPFIVKPSREGCSVAISKIKNRAEIHSALEQAFQYDNHILLEEFIDGREITTTVIDIDSEPFVLTSTETPYRGDFLSVEEKFLPGDSTMITPPHLENSEIVFIKNEVKKAYVALCQQNCSRLDSIWKNGKLYILEPNSPPGMTPSTMVFHEAAAEGWNATEFIEKIIDNSK